MSDRNANPIVVESALSGIAFAIEYEYDKRIRTAEKANGSIAYTAHPASCWTLSVTPPIFVRVRSIRIPVISVALTWSMSLSSSIKILNQQIDNKSHFIYRLETLYKEIDEIYDA